MTAKHTAPTMREALEQIIELEANAPSNGVVRTMLDIARAALSQTEPEPSEPKDEPVAWEPTTAQINSACLSFRHDFGLMNEFDRGILQWQAREWLRAWQKEGLGADHNEIIERRAQEPKDEPVAWMFEDELPPSYPYDRMFEHSEVRGGVRVFPVYTRPALDREKVALPGDEWRPIESAPKDGTFVLLYSPDSERNPFIGQWIEDNDYPDGGAWWSDCECSGFSIDADPTHFMPLPAPPAKQEAAE